MSSDCGFGVLYVCGLLVGGLLAVCDCVFIVLLYWCVTCRWCIWLDGWVVGEFLGGC